MQAGRTISSYWPLQPKGPKDGSPYRRQYLCPRVFSWLCSCPDSVVVHIQRNARKYPILFYSLPPKTMSGPAPQLSSQQLEALLNGPAGPPPPGARSNFDDPPNINGLVILTLTLCLVFATLAVLMRTCTKLFLIRSWDYEDYAIILGWLLQIAQAVPATLIIRDGGGVHIWDIQLETFSRLLYDVNVHCIIYSFTVFFIKLSILLQYLRIFVPNRKGNMAMFLTIQVVMWSNLLFYLLDIAFFIGLCNPRRKIWQPWLPNGHCFSADVWDMASGTFNAVSDITILILPMPCLWRLQMPFKKKLVTIGIFATGFFACVTSVTRTYYTWKVVEEPDTSYNIVMMGLWTLAEVATGVIVCCLPVLPRFLRHAGPKVYRAFSIRSKSSSSSDSANSERMARPSLTSPTFPLARPCQIASIPKTLNNSRVHKAHVKRNYTELEEQDAKLSRTKAMQHLHPGPTSSNRDVESGGYGFPVRDTFYGGTRCDTSF